MGLQRRGKNKLFTFIMRVPARYAHIDPRRFAKISLNTDVTNVAKEKEPQVRKLLLARWDALAAGRDNDAEQYHAKLVVISEASGFAFIPVDQADTMALREILERIEAFDPRGVETSDALLGVSAGFAMPLSGLFDRHVELSQVALKSKSKLQMKKWAGHPRRCSDNLLKVIGDVDLTDLTRAHALKFRDWLSVRVLANELKPESANREMYTVGAMIKHATKMATGTEVDVFGGLLFPKTKTKRRAGQVSFSPDWITANFRDSGGFGRLNADAVAIFQAMINTGARPSELVAIRAEQIKLVADIPHIRIEAVDRELKTVHSQRTIPLVGVSLAAFQRFPDGFKRYTNPDSFSVLMMKYLRVNKMLESPVHTVYSLRHSFRDRLRNAGCPDSIADDLMGHQIQGTDYGQGAPLSVTLAWLKKIAL